ncbi:MAG: phage tail tape measure protein [Micromonosporaceae bacterium]|nr:phage tail tape measure protein [Micromonosporaceae bacterium]
MVIEAARLAVIVEAQVAQAERDLARFGVVLNSVSTNLNGTAQKAAHAAEGVTRATRVMSRSAADAHRAGRSAAEGLTAVATASVRAGTATEEASRRLRVVSRSASDVHGAGRQASEGLTAVATAAERAAPAAERAAAGAKRAGDAAEDAGRKAKSGAQGFTIFGQSLDRIGSQLTSMGTRLSIGVTAPLTLAGRALFNAGRDFESAFAGVRKTVDATEPEFARLREGIIQMAREIPAAREEIARVMEVAGQLGIATDHLLEFTRVAINMGVATTMSSDDAAMAMARFMNIMQTPQEQVEQLANVVVHLGNNVAATESEIMNMALRIAGAGQVIGLTEAQVMGLAAGLSAVGIRAEMGGSAISRTMIEMANAVATGSAELALFADVAGMTVDEFARLFREDAAAAIIAFIEGLGTVRAEGDNVFQLLDELGLAEIRVRDLLLRSAGAGQLLRETQELANEAVREGNALAVEAARRYDTVESRLRTLRTTASEAGVAIFDMFRPEIIGVIEAARRAITGFVDALANADKSLVAFGLGFAGMVAAAGPALVVIGSVISFLGGPLTAAITGGVIALGALAGGFAALATSLDDIRRVSPETAAALDETWSGVRSLFDGIGESLPKVVAGLAAGAQVITGVALQIGAAFDELRAGFHLLMAVAEGSGLIMAGQLDAAREAFASHVAEAEELYERAEDRQLRSLTLFANVGTTYETVLARLTRGAVDFHGVGDRVGSMAEEMAYRIGGIAGSADEAAGAINGLSAEMLSWDSIFHGIHSRIEAIDAGISQWEGTMQGAERVLEMLQDKQKQGIPLSEAEAKAIERLTWLRDRSAGAVRDDYLPALAEEYSLLADLIQRGDELHAAYQSGDISAEEYYKSLAEVNQRYAELVASADPATAATFGLAQAQEQTASVMERVLERLENIMIALGLLPASQEIELTMPGIDEVQRKLTEVNEMEIAGKTVDVEASTDTAMERLREVERQIAAVPKSFTVTADVDISLAEQKITQLGRLLPHSPAEEGPLSVEPNWDWLFEGLAVAAERYSKEAVDKVRSYIDAIRGGFGALRESLTFSREFAVFGASGLPLPDAAAISPLVGLSEAVATAFADSGAALAAGRAEEWADQAKTFVDTASGGIRALGDLLKLLTDLSEAPEFRDDEETRQKLSRLKFLSEHVAYSVGDTAAVIAANRPAGFTELAREYAESVTPGIGALAEMFQLVSDLLDEAAPAIRDDQALRDRISALKFLAEHVALSIGDTARFVAASRPLGFGEQMRAFGEDVVPGIQALTEMVRLIQDLTAEQTPATFDHATFRDRLTALKQMVEQVALDISDVAAAMAEGRPEGFAEQVTQQMEAARAAIGAEMDALRLLNEMVEGTGFGIRPERLRERSRFLADTVVLIATDISAATDRLLTEAPGIVENLETFTEIVAPAMEGVSDAVEAFEGLATMTRINKRQADIFADNMGLAAQAIRRGIDPLERMAEEGITARFQQLIMDIVNPLKVALTALGGSGSTSGGSRVSQSASGVRVVSPSPELSSSPSRQIGGVPVSYGGGGPVLHQTINVHVGNEQLLSQTLRGLHRQVRLGSGVTVGG